MVPRVPKVNWLVTVGCLLCYGCASTPDDPTRFVPSADGSEIRDAKTSLVWKRCSEGQSWEIDTCTGKALAFANSETISYGRTQLGWRVPSVKELETILDRNRAFPAIDTKAFPETMSTGYWTSTPDVAYRGSNWFVVFGIPFVNSGGQDSRLRFFLRMVREGPH